MSVPPSSGIEIPCVEIVERITDYLEDALDPIEHRLVEEHLADCPPCAWYLDQIRATVELLGHVPQDTLSDDAWAELRAVFRSR